MDSYSELIGKINFGLRNFRDLFREQGMVNVKVDARITALEKRAKELEKELYEAAYNINDGINGK